MQQSAIRWLHGVRLQNATSMAFVDLRVVVSASVLGSPLTLHVAEVPANSGLDVPVPDLPLPAATFANLVERERADLHVRVESGDQQLAAHTSAIDVLAYNEWPGLAVLPGLLAAFTAPNHPALPPLLRDVAARLQAATGNGALDGYQSGDPQRARAMVAAVHATIAALGITYCNPPPSFEVRGQKVRTPEQVTGERLGTCLDLALSYAALLEHIGLHPFVVLQTGHAMVGAWLVDASVPEVTFGPAVEVRKRVDLGALVVVECTLACVDAAAPFDAAVREARKRLDDDGAFVTAVDVAAARRAGIRPLPPRTMAFAVPATDLVGPDVGAPAPTPATAVPRPEPSPALVDEPDARRGPEVPHDRLEHWKGKLLDLSMWNRLLNFVETKKTVPFEDHDLGALVARLQAGGRVRVHPRAAVAAGSGDPRDLELAQQRTGSDVRADYLAEELRAGRLRAALDPEVLDLRLVEIFRHARTSLEETGANTLHLAIGFLHWYESPQSTKPRRAPLLLLPLTIERLSVREGFRFALDDAEPRVNQSLLQMLLRDHDVRVPLGDTLPEDDTGVDVRAVLDAFRSAVLPMARWEVQTAACIGFFSFAKYLMWLDLSARDELLQSPVLRHLVEKPGAGFLQEQGEMPRDEIDDLDPAQVFCPKDADSSQLAAVLAGAAGRSFVLEGPPGTGKSQTITNLIAQALANGKRVLFVAEKRAALEVVQRRLDEVGLGPFCLELHSSKSGPKAVHSQLRRALEVGARRQPGEWESVAGSLQQERRRLNRFVHDLHRPREHGGSVFAAMTELVVLGPGPRVPLPELRVVDAAAVAAAAAAIADLAAVGKALGVPDQEPWWGVRLRDWTPALARDVVPHAQRLVDAAVAKAAAVARVAAAFGLDAMFGQEGPSERQVELLSELAARFTTPSLPPSALLAADWRTLRSRLVELVAVGARRQDAWNGLAKRWRPELLGLDLGRLVAIHRDAVPAFVLLRWWRLRPVRRELRSVALPRHLPDAAAVLADLEVAITVRDADRRIAEESATTALLGEAWQREATEWARVEAFVPWIEDVRRLCVQIEPGALQPSPRLLATIGACLDGVANGSKELAERIGALRLANDEFAVALRAAAAPLQLDLVAAFGTDQQPGHLRRVEARARGWLAAIPRLRDHCAYERAAQAATAAALGPLVVAHAHGAQRTDELVPVFRRTFLEAWLDTVHRQEPELARFRGQDHEAAIARFADLDRRTIRLAAEVVLARLAAQVPQVRDTQVASSELGILEREIKKQRRHKPVRRLLAEIPGLFARLAPCVLMSPLSVAQFLGRAATRFDLVVFDEASQIPVQDAVGAIGRGTSLVVVGDSRQLPPTTFFQRLSQGDEPSPDDVPEDLESVLDECAAAGLPRAHLDWHYRSRHESLIAFSNQHYYENRLLTFPAPQQAMPGLGVRFVHVGGVYDRAGSQQNRREAEALVAEVVARLRDPQRARHSLGIVTFSQAQQVLIEDLLDKARAEHPEIEPCFGSATEPVFVKNLENVQGDERDTILFSICYGPDAAGRIHENYGPLNQQGGERRLNVAVTRARRELVVFASLRADQVAQRTPALGARHLRAFLDYAQRGPAALVAVAAHDPSLGTESPFEAAVCTALRARGHEVHTQVGCSGYRIDLAVVDPRAPGRYLLGIECDGAAYHSAATARDRDRLRGAVLAGLGWRLHRVWSTDFWQDPAGELDRVEAAIAAACAVALPEVPPEPAVVSVVAEEPVPPPAVTTPELADADGPRSYAAVADGTVDVARVLAVEGPVVFERLARMLAAAWGLSRVTDRARERVRAALPGEAVEVDGVVWASREQMGAFRGFRVPGGVAGEGDGDGEVAPRSAEELPAVEVENALLWLLRQHQAIAAEDLAREAARRFGIQRLGAVVRDVMDRALTRMVASGRCARDGDVVRSG